MKSLQHANKQETAPRQVKRLKNAVVNYKDRSASRPRKNRKRG